MAQIALCGFEFLLLPFGGSFCLHSRFGQRTCLALSPRARFRQRLRFCLGLRSSGRKGHLLLRFLLGLLAGQRGANLVRAVALLFFFGNLYVQRDASSFRGGLRPPRLFQRALFGIAPRLCFHIETGTQLRLALGPRARLGLRLLTRHSERCREFGVVAGGCRSMHWCRRCGALNLTGRRWRTVLRGFEGRRRRRVKSRFLWRGKIEIVVIAAELTERFLFLDFEYFDVPILLQRRQHFCQRRHRQIGFVHQRVDVGFAVDCLQCSHHFPGERLGLLVHLCDALGGFGENCFCIHRLILLSKIVVTAPEICSTRQHYLSWCDGRALKQVIIFSRIIN